MPHLPVQAEVQLGKRVQYTRRNPIGLGLSIGSMGLDHYNSIGLECYIGSMGLDHHDSIGLEC